MKDIYKKWWFWLIVIIIILAIVNYSMWKKSCGGSNPPAEGWDCSFTGYIKSLTSAFTNQK